MNAKKQALGRGLSALLSAPDTDIVSRDSRGTTVVGAIAQIKLTQIEANPFQPRTEFEEIALQELCDSIKVHGIIQPITVRKINADKYQLISGERRFRASKMAGLTEIPAYIRIATDVQMLEMALVENIQRENLNSIEVALSYQALMDECNLTQEQLSEKVGKNRSTITNYLRLLKLPAEVQLDIRDEKISMGHARAIINIDTPEKQIDIVRQIIEKDLSVREVETLVREMNVSPVIKQKIKKNATLPIPHQSFSNFYAQKLNTKIEVKRNKKGKGSILIHFSSDKDFERILAELEK